MMICCVKYGFSAPQRYSVPGRYTVLHGKCGDARPHFWMKCREIPAFSLKQVKEKEESVEQNHHFVEKNGAYVLHYKRL